MIEPIFDHERLDVYRLSIQYVTSSYRAVLKLTIFRACRMTRTRISDKSIVTLSRLTNPTNQTFVPIAAILHVCLSVA